MEQFKALLKRGLRDRKPRQLIITDDSISFEDKTFTKDRFTTFEKSEITAYKFGVRWIRLHLIFGREYVLYIQNRKNDVLKINFKTYFRYKIKQRHELFNDILEALYTYHFNAIIANYVSLYTAKTQFSIGNVIFSEHGITIQSNASLKVRDIFIAWDKIRTKNYYTYFAIYSADDPRNINSAHNYLEDWNSGLLYSIVGSIVKHRNPETIDNEA
jgi:hypothetical protein